ncbi:phospholipid transport system transporter-binding protein [Thiogranum longum]|uniref:Phospholipid transport system transporter-binding protein n=1 Tax=Thiogranum longum TaxID=1537524 RepID=A0A4V2PGN7_9GAMM|nr:STAS domain-containing protein [Thiogranum longum]TCK17566.1 phospholipid transport system transporter-binding protein [Thiogranum longum]
MTTNPPTIQPGRDGRLEVHGELSFDSVPGLWRDCRETCVAGDDVDIDLGQVQRSDSAGLALLIEWLREAQRSGARLRFFNIPPQMLEMARASGLDRILPLHRD